MARLRVERSSSRISVPVMSDGMRSGVNWMRRKVRSSASPRLMMSRVLARPGTPVMRQCPPAKNDKSTCSTTSSWPMMTRRSC